MICCICCFYLLLIYLLMTLLHRVVVYGDHMDSIRHLARLMNLKVVEEG